MGQLKTIISESVATVGVYDSMQISFGARLAAVVAAALCCPALIQAATTTTDIDSANSAMGVTAHGCLQQLTTSVSEGENCMYDGGMVVYEFPPGVLPANPFGEATGPFSQAQYYDSINTPQAFAANFVPTPGDGKIRQVISGTMTVDDNGNGFGADDLISFDITMTSPGGGNIIRNLGSNVADQYTSMTQVLAPTAVSSATPNASGGFDYVIGSEGFPVLLTFTDATANGGACVGQTFGDMECDASFDVNGFSDPLRWTPWAPTDQSAFAGQFPIPHNGPPKSAGIGSLEGNFGARTTGTVVNLTCADDGVTTPAGSPPGSTWCTAGKTSFNPLVNGPNQTPASGDGAEDVGWDQLLLKVSTDAFGNVLSAEGFDVQEYMVFGLPGSCGSDPGAGNLCNTWLAGHFTIAGAVASIPGVSNYMIDPGSYQSKVDNTCLGALPGATGEDCTYNQSDPTGGTFAWLGPIHAAGYYAVGNSPFANAIPGSFPLPAAPVPDPEKIELPVTGSLTIDLDNGSQCDGDDTVAGRFALPAATRTFGGGPGTSAEETWGDNTIVYVLPASVPDFQNVTAAGCEYIFGSQGFPSLLQTMGLFNGVQTYPVDLVIGADPLEPFNGDQDAWAAPEPSGIGIGQFEGPAPDNLGNVGVAVSLDLSVFYGGTWSCVDNFGDVRNPTAQVSGGQCVFGPSADNTPCSSFGSNFCGIRGVGNPDFGSPSPDDGAGQENWIMRIVVNDDGNIVEGTIFANNESVIFNVPPAPERNNSWDGPLISFTATCVDCDPLDSDQDGVLDRNDNCTLAPNGPTMPDAGGNVQLDTDGDGFGNLCDGDLNNDNRTNSLDLGLFKARFFTADPDADYNGDGLRELAGSRHLQEPFRQAAGPGG